MKRSRTTCLLRIPLLAALAVPLAALAQEPPDQPPVDPTTPADTALPTDAVPPADPTEATPPWMPPPAAPPARSSPPATPPAQSAQSETGHRVLQDAHGREVRLQQHPPDSVIGDYSIDFETLDSDRDGGISRSEARANPTLEAEFDAVDRNRDGRLSREELDDWNR